jgi:hypothetical protein
LYGRSDLALEESTQIFSAGQVISAYRGDHGPLQRMKGFGRQIVGQWLHRTSHQRRWWREKEEVAVLQFEKKFSGAFLSR